MPRRGAVQRSALILAALAAKLEAADSQHKFDLLYDIELRLYDGGLIDQLQKDLRRSA